MSEIMLQHNVHREFVSGCDWDRRFAAIPDENLVDPSFVPHLLGWAKSVAASFGDAYRETIEVEAARASEAEVLAKKATSEMETHINEIEKLYSAAPGGNWVSGCLLTGAYILAVASEAYLNKSVLPWILGASGIGTFALMVGPAFILPSTLERLSHELLETTSRWGRIVHGVMNCVVALMILAVVALIGLSRGAVAEIRSGQDMTAHQSHIVDATLLWLGVCVCICAVVCAYSSGVEFKRVFHLRQLKRQLVQAKAGLQTAREAAAAAASTRASTAKRLEMREGLAIRYQEEFLTQRLAEISSRLAQIKTTTPVTQMLEWAERIRVFASLGLGWNLSVISPHIPSAKFAVLPEAEEEAAA